MSKKTFSKLLSEKFQISRKKAEGLIKNKKVLLNDNIESRPYLVVQEKDVISLNKPIEKKVNLILFHKPKGCITSRSDEKNSVDDKNDKNEIKKQILVMIVKKRMLNLLRRKMKSSQILVI